MAKKRVKISFETINDGNYTTISNETITQTNNRVKTAMKKVVRAYEQKEIKSQQKAALLVLNA